MRLSDREVKIILEEVSRLDSSAETYLFGSRVNDNLKGGDIDLLVMSSTLRFADKLTLLVNLKDRLGDQKIDLKIATRETASSDPFIASIFPGARKLG